MSDKRSVATDALETLGTIIDNGQKRDAIHLAVEPIEAGEKLIPGSDIGIDVDGKAYSKKKGIKLLGIVDPFLKQAVNKGEFFWLVVYPRQITSLRHVWSHPDFKESDVYSEPVKSDPIVTEKEKSEAWIRNYAASIGLRYDILMQGAESHVRSMTKGGWGEYINYGELLDGVYTADEFWNHYEIVKGVEIDENHKGNFFSCSC